MFTFISAIAYANLTSPKSGDELVSNIIDNCADMGCVKSNVLSYLDNILNIRNDNERSYKVHIFY